MRNLHSVIFAVAAFATATTTVAEAKPRKVVIIDFDGLPRTLADTGRSNVLALLGDQYDLVPTKKWESARAQAQGRGPAQWQQASKSSGVDAVIEGWINTEGRHHTLTVQIRDAATGNEIDSVSVKIGDKGLSTESQHDLATQLNEVLDWIDGDATSSSAGVNLPILDTRPRLGSHDFTKRHDDSDDSDDDRDERPRKKSKLKMRRDRDDRPSHDDRDTRDSRDSRDSRSGRDERRDDDRKSSRRSERDDHPDERDERDERDDKKSSKDSSDDLGDIRRDSDAKPSLKQVATSDATPLTNVLMPEIRTQDIISEAPAPRIMKPAPKFLITGGGFVASRGMSFTQDADATGNAPPSYPAQGVSGIQIGISVFPMPTEKLSSDPSGIGFSLNIKKSVGSLVTADNSVANTSGDYEYDYTSWEGGVHYRYPTDLVALTGSFTLGNENNSIAFSQGIDIPDASYNYVGIGGAIDLKVTDRTRAGIGAKYMYVTSVGDVSDEHWYGAGSASGLMLDAHFQIPVSDMLFLRGELDYRRVSMDFEESGDLSYGYGISNITDSSIGASAQLGVQF